MSPSPSFQLKMTPLLPLPPFLFTQQVWKIKSNIEYRGKGEEKQNTVENQFFQKFM